MKPAIAIATVISFHTHAKTQNAKARKVNSENVIQSYTVDVNGMAFISVLITQKKSLTEHKNKNVDVKDLVFANMALA